ncbi:MAG: glutamate-5-semialdehyde dehydrogenase, partial [Bacteroidota bacterium]|nr:glutamate-5-semialdehyde dehydrogenase [Bacteroidota bacterium]
MASIESLLIRTHKAAAGLRRATEQQLQAALASLADAILRDQALLLKANAKDLAAQSPDNPRNDRLMLDPARIRAIADSIRKVAALPDPSGKILEKRRLENGLLVEKMAVPLGVVGAIYESRPNVTFDIAVLCLRSRNACVLKGSSEADHSNKAAIRIIRSVLAEHGIPPDAVTLLPSDRATVQELFGATRWVDVLIPRGSDSLIKYVRKHSLVPVIETGAGVCHLYIEKEADLEMAVSIAVNAKVSRPSVCNAIDTILVDRDIAPEFLKRLQP